MARKAIEIKDLNYAYPDGTRALSHPDLVSRMCTRVAILDKGRRRISVTG